MRLPPFKTCSTCGNSASQPRRFSFTPFFLTRSQLSQVRRTRSSASSNGTDCWTCSLFTCLTGAWGSDECCPRGFGIVADCADKYVRTWERKSTPKKNVGETKISSHPGQHLKYPLAVLPLRGERRADIQQIFRPPVLVIKEGQQA